MHVDVETEQPIEQMNQDMPLHLSSWIVAFIQEFDSVD